MSGDPKNPAATGGAERWLIGPASDLLLGCGAGYALLFVGLIAIGPSVRETIPLGILTLVLLVTSVPHYGATLVRVYEQRESRRRYAIFSVWISLALGIAFVAACYWDTLASSLVTLYFNWSPWHYAGQNYGIALMFLHRRGVPIPPRAKRLLYASFVLSFLLALVEMNGSTPGAVYALDGAEGADTTGAKSFAPAFHFISLGLPGDVQTVLMAVGLVAYLGTLVAAFGMLRRGGRAIDFLPSALLVLSQSLWFVVPASFRLWGLYSETIPFSQTDFRYAFIWVAVGHSVQYLWITTYYAKRESDRRRSSIHFLQCVLAGSLIWNVPAFLMGPALFGVIQYSDGLPLLIATMVNLHHFVLDGAIWKLRDGRVASVLLRTRSDPAEAIGPKADFSWTRPAIWAVGALCFALAFVSDYEREFGMRRARQSGDLDRLQAAVDRLQWAGKDDALNHRTLGIVAARNQQPDLALEAFEKSLRLREHPKAWFEMGHIYVKRGEWRKAADAYEGAYRLDPQPEILIGKLAGALLRAGDPARAREVLLEGLQRHPEHPVLEQQLERAEQALQRSASRQPVQPAVHPDT